MEKLNIKEKFYQMINIINNRKLQLLLLAMPMAFCCCKSQSVILKKETTDYVSSCADSINAMKYRDPLPSFLLKPCLDGQSYMWPNMHEPIPIRKLIVNKVNNKEALSYILSLKDPRLQEVCARKDTVSSGLKYYRMPFAEMSFHSLLYTRLSELRNGMRY